MGRDHHVSRLQDAVPPPAPTTFRGPSDFSHRPREGPVLVTRGGQALGQTSNNPGTPTFTERWVLLHLLSNPQKRRVSQAHTRPKRVEFVPQGPSLSDASHSRRPTNHRSGRVVHLHRPQRRIFSRADTPGAQKIPTVCLPRPSLPVRRPTVRHIPSSPHLHQMHEGSINITKSIGSEDTPLSRRLAHLRPLIQGGGAGDIQSSRSHRGTGHVGEPREEFVGPDATNDLHRHLPGFGIESSTADYAEGRENTEPPAVFPLGGNADCSNVAQTDRHADLSLSNHSSGAVTSTPTTEVVQRPSHGPLSTQEGQGQSHSQVPRLSPTVAEQCVPAAGGSSRLSPGEARGSNNRCLAPRLGSGMAEEVSPGSVVLSVERPPYQCIRTPDCLLGAEALLALSQGEACARSDGQHLSGVPCQPSGGNQIARVPEGSSTTVDLGLSSVRLIESNAPARQSKLCGRLSVSSETALWGVEIAPPGGTVDLGSLRGSPSRSICLGEHNTLSSVVQPGRDQCPTWNGCSGQHLAESASLCVSSNPPVVAAATQGEVIGLQGPLSGPEMALEIMVSDSPQSIRRRSLAASGENRPPVPAGREGMASIAVSPSALGMAIEGGQSLLSELDPSIYETLRSARAPSTRLVYSNCWAAFSSWCSDRGLDPVSCPLRHAAATLRVHTAAISFSHSHIDGRSVGAHYWVKQFLRGAKRRRPPRVRQAAAWDLPLVLQALSKAPFEPMAGASLRLISIKTAFLLAVTTAKRVGELHALSISPACLHWKADNSGVTLRPNVSFLPKVLPSGYVNQAIELAAFHPPPFTSVEEERAHLLCPVRALRLYIQATQVFRRSEQLFVCYGGRNKGCALSKQRLSHWVVDTIKKAYEVAGKPVPSDIICHSTRGVATSWAAMRGVSLADVCAAASWTAPCTFSRFYRLDVASGSSLASAILPLAAPAD